MLRAMIIICYLSNQTENHLSLFFICLFSLDTSIFNFIRHSTIRPPCILLMQPVPLCLLALALPNEVIIPASYGVLFTHEGRVWSGHDYWFHAMDVPS